MPDEPSPWRAHSILELDDETLRQLIALVVRYEQTWGRYPTPENLRQMLTHP